MRKKAKPTETEEKDFKIATLTMGKADEPGKL